MSLILKVPPESSEKMRGRWRHRVLRWVKELAVLLLIIVAVGLFQTRNHPRGVAPAYTFATLEHKTVELQSLVGKPALLVVWAPWCGVCKAQSDNVSRVSRWVGARAQVVSVATAYSSTADVRQYMTQQQVEYPVLLAGDDFSQVMHIDAFPTVFVLDREGRIVTSVQGYTTTGGLLARLLWASISH